ncbi:Superfamily II DNA and RNA helicase [Paracoccus isoporae]|uniref:DEAD-box ATP-dependent RNA helicase RhpA n=1 Tax=Paracoccus isoporae TaxID=591205 RepID=A0A1G7EQS2_9RHOB|nr:Superfamily II DNA and RNA helicase [Paracoccus isoporae]
MTKFSDLKLDPKVLKAIAEAGYDNPTPIQAGAIPVALEGRDVLGIAQTGTGKTASFTLPMITRLSRGRARARMPRSLVLCPTRELAAQVAENFDIYAKHTRLTKALLIGGVSFGEQDKLIDRGVDVLIATPGRLLDHFERGKLLLTGVEVMVVDEADRMLDMGFIPDIERIFQLTPFTRQTLFFSATMAPEIERITNTFLHSPERIEVARQATTSETITQKLVEITPTRRDQTAKQKRELLRALIEAEGEGLKNAIIFCNRKTEVDIVAKSLKKHGLDAAPIHGDLDQSQRTRTLESFRDGSLRFLVASDVAARGLDIPAVSHVFNFDLPSHAEDYVHRIGRTGRAGRQGTAYSIATPADEKYLSGIENLVKHALPRMDPPDGFSLSENARSAPRGNDRDAKGGRSRSRSRRGERAAQDSGPDANVSNATAEPARPADDTAPPAREERRHDRGGRGERQEDRRGDNRAESRGDNRRSGRGDNRRRDHGPAVTGMGDHVPEFLKQSFSVALAATEAAIDRADSTDDAPQQSGADGETGGDNSGPKPRARRSRSRKADSVSPDQAATPADGAEGESGKAPSEAEAAEAAQPEEKKPARRRRSKKAEAEAAQAEDAAPADTPADPAEEQPKPAKRPRRSSRAKAKEAEAAGEDGSAAETEAGADQPEAEPKPKRSRAPRKKPAAKTDEAAAETKADSDEAADAAPKPRRRAATTRSRKKPAADDAGADSTAGDGAAQPAGDGGDPGSTDG